MPNRKWHKNIVGTSDFFLGELAAALPTLVSVLLRIACLYLFFWYLLDFIFELWLEHSPFAIFVSLVALLALGILIWKMINSWDNFDLDRDLADGGLSRFVLLNLLPISAVAVATWYGHNFSWGLLRFTQWALKRIASVL